MKRVLISLSMLLVMATAASAEYVLVSDTDYGTSNGISWVEAAEFTGTDGIDGVNADNSKIYALLTKQEAASSAISSVELNPDHLGFSMSLGVAKPDGVAAGAVGMMYAHKVGTTNVGYNLKAYNAEGGYKGFSGGITLGF